MISFNTILVVILLFVTTSSNASSLLFSEDFEKGYESVVYQYLKAHGFDAIIAPGQGVGGSKGLIVKYVSIYKGSSRVKGFFKLSKKTTEASLSYDVYFNKDFQFVLGGKMHGLGPDAVITGDWKMRPDGWSSRIMWGKEGKVETVLVLQNQEGKWGTYRGNDSFQFKKERYYSITLYTRLNSGPNKQDGEAHLYIDGELLVKYKKAQYWSDPLKDSRISQFLFSTFHGGGTSDWAPKDENGNHVNVHATFDNFQIKEGLAVRKDTN